jgi:hypothetical protein
MEVSGWLHASVALPTGKNPAAHWRLDGPQNWCGRFGEQKNLLPLPEVDPQTVQALSVVAVPSALPPAPISEQVASQF